MKYLIDDSGQLYTVQNDTLVAVSGTVTAALFQSDGFDDLTNVEDLLVSLTRPTVLAWDSDEQPNIVASVTGVPLPQDIIATTRLMEVIGVSSITATYTGEPLVAVAINSGEYAQFNATTEEWEQAADHDGMTIPDMQDISAEEWEALLNGASLFSLRITLQTTTDTVSAFSIVFTTN